MCPDCERFLDEDKQKTQPTDLFHICTLNQLKKPTSKVCENAERAKRALNCERILHVEKGTFAPLIFSVTGDTCPEARTFLRPLCEKVAHKNRQDYSYVSNFIKCKLSFLIRKLIILCIREVQGQ